MPMEEDGRRRDWGGYSGYFADPDGFRWEVAWNPGEIGVQILAESLAWWTERGRRAARTTGTTPA